MPKNSFLLYFDYRQHLDLIQDDGDFRRLIEAIFDYCGTGQEPSGLSAVAQMAFSFIRSNLDRDNEKYEAIKEKRRNAGSLGGKAKASNAKQMLASASKSQQTLANVADNVTVTDTVTDNIFTPSNEGVVAAEPGDDEKPMKKSCPPCPHKQLVEAYHDTIPTLPKVKVWDKERERNMQARWRERWAAGKYATQQEGLAYWIRFFEYVKDSCPWLMGKVSDRNGKAFRADLGWMILPRNFKKIIEGRYEVQQQQDNSGDDLLAHIDAARREAREAAERHARENSPWRRS